MTLSTGDIIKTACTFRLENAVFYQNIFHHLFDGIGGVSDATIVSTIATWAGAMYDTLVSIAEDNIVGQVSSVDQVEWVIDEWKVVANLGTYVQGFTPVGGLEVCPNQVSAFITFKTSRPKTVGRKFLFPAMETSQNAGIMGAGYVEDVVDFADIAVNDIEVDAFNVLHPGVPRTGVNDWQGFVSATVTDLLGTQRRRRPGYGA